MDLFSSFFGAAGRDRTGMILLSQDFESCAYTSSATAARQNILYHTLLPQVNTFLIISFYFFLFPFIF